MPRRVKHIRGYIEGYYGRLLSWRDRGMILETLARLGMNAYLYAPKEDPMHRLHWREDWHPSWWREFRNFTRMADAENIRIMAGISPGGDFDFASMRKRSRQNDTAILIAKSRRLIRAGADVIVLGLDDIAPLPRKRLGGFPDEGTAHGVLARTLAHNIPAPVAIVPRVYAGEIAATESDNRYLTSLAATLMGGRGAKQNIKMFFCGSHIIAPHIRPEYPPLRQRGIARDRIIIWDNLYANDYCPRRLFLGPYRGRNMAASIMLNPTGMPHTDCLLLAFMAAGNDKKAWRETILRHHVPPEFFTIARFFDLPPDPRYPPAKPHFTPANAPRLLAALDTLLWQWKHPLAQEWYPYLMGLRSDILLRSGNMRMDKLRQAKTLPPLLLR